MQTFTFSQEVAFALAANHRLVVLEEGELSFYDINLMQTAAIDILYASAAEAYALDKEVTLNFTIEAVDGEDTYLSNSKVV
jgi:hypothetical protein